MSRLIDLIDTALPIPNIKLADQAIFSLSQIEVSSCYNSFNWSMPPVDWVKTLESINNLLNSVLLYLDLVDKLKT